MATKKQPAPAPEPALTKVGECLFREKDGSLWIAESYSDPDGKVTTQQMMVSKGEG